MSVYREIPLSFGTLVLVHPAENPDAVRASWKVSPPASLIQAPNDRDFDFELPNDDTENDPLDVEIASTDSVGTSTTEHKLVGVDGNILEDTSGKVSEGREYHGSGEERSPARNDECALMLSPPSSSWPDDILVEISTDHVKIGPATQGTATAQKPHVCEICGRPFRRKKDIRRHIATHSNDKPFFCWICCLTFRSRDNLRRHLKRVHKEWHLSEGHHPRSCFPQSQATRHCSLEKPAVYEQSATMHAEGEGQGTESRKVWIKVPKRQESLPQHHATEEVVENVHTSVTDGPTEETKVDGKITRVSTAEETNVKPHVILRKGFMDGTLSKVKACSRPSSLPRQPEATDTCQKKKTICAMYLCDGCGNLIPHNNVMVLSNRHTASGSKPRLLCKVCFIKKTGIICIG